LREAGGGPAGFLESCLQVNLSTVLALLAASLGTYVGLLSWRYRRAPGLKDQGWFALVAFTASGFTALNVVTTSTTASDALILWGARLQLVLSAFHAVAWLRYCSAFLGRPWRHETVASLVIVSSSLLVLLPGLGFTGAVSYRPVASWGVVYRDAELGPLGMVVAATVLLVFLVQVGRFAGGWRRGVAYAWVHTLALAFLFLMGANDALTLTGLLNGAYLLDLGFLVPVGAVTYAVSGRIVEESRTLAALWGQLERIVEERTTELAASRDALHRAEKLAALGQFSAGVSHEVSNPASVVAANMRYLEEALRAGPLPPDALECVVESREAVDRIARLTRQLLDASRLASAPQAQASRLVLAEVVSDALAAALPRLGGHDLQVAVPADLCALGLQQSLSQVLDRLLDNAVRSLRPGAAGRITVSGERALGRARLVVEDDGVGMSEETLRRAFDPFFSTRAFGTGTGLGLAVARGLIQSMRGDLRLESTPGRGTRAIVELPLAEAAAPPAGPEQRVLPLPA
jgi:signal transduction histidine kinase